MDACDTANHPLGLPYVLAIRRGTRMYCGFIGMAQLPSGLYIMIACHPCIRPEPAGLCQASAWGVRGSRQAAAWEKMPLPQGVPHPPPCGAAPSAPSLTTAQAAPPLGTARLWQPRVTGAPFFLNLKNSILLSCVVLLDCSSQVGGQEGETYRRDIYIVWTGKWAVKECCVACLVPTSPPLALSVGLGAHQRTAIYDSCIRNRKCVISAGAQPSSERCRAKRLPGGFSIPGSGPP